MTATAVMNHGVMEGSGSYNRHARIAAGGAALAVPLLEQTAREVELGGGDSPVLIANYGSSQGKNSLSPMQAVIRTQRGRVVPTGPSSCSTSIGLRTISIRSLKCLTNTRTDTRWASRTFGLIRGRTGANRHLAGRPFLYHENVRKIIGERTRKMYSIGDQLRDRLDRTDTVKRKLQFAVIEVGDAGRLRRGKKR
jgi:hypothetical protein